MHNHLWSWLWLWKSLFNMFLGIWFSKRGPRVQLRHWCTAHSAFLYIVFMLDGISTASNDKDHHNVNGNFVSSVWSQMKSKMKEMAYIKISNHFLLPANTRANFIIIYSSKWKTRNYYSRRRGKFRFTFFFFIWIKMNFRFFFPIQKAGTEATCPYLTAFN